MIPSIHERGSDAAGLIGYLYGPGTKEEHTDPHLVAAFDPLTPDPGRDRGATYQQLQRLLDQPVNALPKGRRPAKHVWHISVRASPEDPVLSDEDWAAIARRTVAATGIAPDGDERACRWAAVRHADDHIHIIATLVRDDGRRPRLHNEARRAQAEARRIEADYGLRRVTPGDGTAAKRPTRAARHKAERLGQEAASQELLREHVRRALAGVADEAEFFDRLAAEGVRIDKRIAPSGDVLGYKVAIVGDRNKDNEPVWYAGSTLAPDLSLPRIRKRFTAAMDTDAPLTALDRGGASAPARARYAAAQAADSARVTLTFGDEGIAAAHLVGIGEVLDALAQTTAGPSRAELREAAWHFERATRSHIRARDEEMYALRRAARQIVHSGTTAGRSPDGAATALILDVVVLAVIAAARWHAARGHAQQAQAAQQAADHLRTAYQAAAAEPLAVLRVYGERLPALTRRRHAAAVRAAVPHLVDRLQAEPGWNSLVMVLDQAERAGYDTAALLAKAAAQRELGSADSASDVLVWRLHHLGYITPPPRSPDQQSKPTPTAPPAHTPASPATQPHRTR
ncbi:relaxase/mobilization nuclease domain-containing protein [Streptomyces sp. TRM66268-LWL]|uniref:Relaxase/mobilization nuclease domain-containing protein n=1 Tax=Streptomyces polyasparticus TaxID=2767826 RepID=A0ABR7SHE1_9ACTN|nr:relaxase/mobilization nuclease domain-containing protein [Streptomyces polyasparticus]MBC9714344.1 relaxase/mobilization nuclease domain-containing protein [Streptomyces polyasparticus]